jgi:DNA-binding NtrC family response regulator
MEEEIREQRFREELFYRLNVVNLRLPPLRERTEDLPLLLEHFLRHFSQRSGKEVNGFTSEALNHLLRYSWPGNVRELENRVERAVLLAEGRTITAADVLLEPESLSPGAKPEGFLPDSLSIKKCKAALETHLIRQALEKHGGNKTKAAAELEISYRALLQKIKDYSL